MRTLELTPAEYVRRHLKFTPYARASRGLDDRGGGPGAVHVPPVEGAGQLLLATRKKPLTSSSRVIPAAIRYGELSPAVAKTSSLSANR